MAEVMAILSGGAGIRTHPARACGLAVVPVSEQGWERAATQREEAGKETRSEMRTGQTGREMGQSYLSGRVASNW